MKKLWQLFLAYFRLSDKAVCEQSKGKGPYDCYHDYPDTEDGEPWHMIEVKCKRCGKGFYI